MRCVWTMTQHQPILSARLRQFLAFPSPGIHWHQPVRSDF